MPVSVNTTILTALLFASIILLYFACVTRLVTDDTHQWILYTRPNITDDCNWITFYDLPVGIGNKMFMYASLYGLAKLYGKKPFLSTPTFILSTIFNLSIKYENYSKSSFVTEQESGCCKFDDGTTRMRCDKNVTLTGFRQSYKYFDKYRNVIKKEFRFNKSMTKRCEKILHRVIRRFEAKNVTNCFLIGAHTRRGDLLDETYQSLGFLPAESSYLKRAIEYFENRFGRQFDCLMFLIIGDDAEWNLRNSPKKFNVIVLPTSSAEVDLCVLSKCNANIISTGTFGWWSAYLAGGPTTYMRNQCKPNSSLCQQYELNDYINPNWDWVPL